MLYDLLESHNGIRKPSVRAILTDAHDERVAHKKRTLLDECEPLYQCCDQFILSTLRVFGTPLSHKANQCIQDQKSSCGWTSSTSAISACDWVAGFELRSQKTPSA